MRALIRGVETLAHGYVLGMMLFFGAIFAPRVFRVLERPQAAALQNSVFFPYFLSGLWMSLFLGLLGFFFWFRFRKKSLLLKGLFYFLCAALFAYCYDEILPQIISLQQQLYSGLAGDTRGGVQASFDHLHRLSVRLNSSILFVFIALSFAPRYSDFFSSSHK